MEISNIQQSSNNERRQRLHELLIALIHQQPKLELMDDEPSSLNSLRTKDLKDEDPAQWLDRNRRVLKTYQEAHA